MGTSSKLSTDPLKPPFTWNPGEHVVITGITGCGKSTLAERLAANREYLVFLRTKPDDCRWQTDRVVKTADEVRAAMRDRRVKRIEVSPPRRGQVEPIHTVLQEALAVGDKRAAYGGWTIVGDEGYRLSQLGLSEEWEEGLTQGRSLGISMVTCVQRPVFVSRFVFSEARHVISFGCEGRDLLTLRDSAGRAHADAVATFKPGTFQCAWTYRVPGGGTYTTVGSLQEWQN